jgi:putative colanic acid biosynthesis UDP-glucose lipid carrier transferase
MALAAFLRQISAAITAIAVLLIGMRVTGTSMSEPYEALLIIVALLAIILFRKSASSELHVTPSILSSAVSTFGAWFVIFTILLVLGYATKTSAFYSRKLLLSWVVITPFAIVGVHALVDRFIERLSRAQARARRVVIAGVNQNAQQLAKKIIENPQLGLSLDGHFDDRNIDRLGLITPGRLIGKLAELPEYVRSNSIDLIYIALPIRNIQRVTELLDALRDTTASIYYAPDVFVFDLIQCRTDDIDGLPVVALCETPFFGSRGVIKRASDIIIASITLILISPFLLLISLAVKATTPGTVIFKQRRYGLDGREIVVYKFRTMRVSEDSDSVKQATRNDNRVTPVGAFLRKYSLDELPQFINVLQGRMSVVGPRPHAVAHNEQYRHLIKGYMVRHKVSPGITVLAQIRGFRGETETVDAMRQRVESDLEYLRNWSLELDLRIIFRTIAMIFKDDKAY